MLRLTRRSEYGLMALAYLASHPDGFCSVREIVDDLKLPKRLLAEVLKDMSRAGLVDATRGPGGGYRLYSEPQTLPLSRVVEVLEGPVAIADCGDDCSLQASCLIQGGLSQVTHSIRKVLDNMTVADLLKQSDTVAEKAILSV
jgi:Rrf2 family transcriptional regulator, nitric oxide-sensitive transcriptional repressor